MHAHDFEGTKATPSRRGANVPPGTAPPKALQSRIGAQAPMR